MMMYLSLIKLSVVSIGHKIYTGDRLKDLIPIVSIPLRTRNNYVVVVLLAFSPAVVTTFVATLVVLILGLGIAWYNNSISTTHPIETQGIDITT